MNNLALVREKMEVLRVELQKEVGDVFSAELKRIFDTYPECKRISAYFFTDFFNDGEPCEFHFHYASLEVAPGFSPDGNTEQDWLDGIGLHYDAGAKKHVPVGDEKWQQFTKEMRELNAFFEDNYDAIGDIYGDHFYLDITSDGIERVEYTEHD